MAPSPPRVAAGMSPEPSSPSPDTLNLVSLFVVVAVALALALLVVMQRGPERAAAGVMPMQQRAASVLPAMRGEAVTGEPSEDESPDAKAQRVRDDLRPR